MGCFEAMLSLHSKHRIGMCKYTEREGLGNIVECDDLITCNRCGWNPAVAKKRAEKVRAERRGELPPKEKERWLIGRGEFPQR